MRIDGWETAFDAVVASRLRAPFQWGANDCASFAAECVKAITGADVLGDMRWADEKSARRVVKRMGGLIRAIDSTGLDRIPVWYAAVGDVAVFEGELGETVGVCVGSRLVSPGPRGLVFRDVKAVAAWRV